MGTDKRARQKAGRDQARIERARIELQAQKRSQRVRIGLAIAVFGIAIAGLAYFRRDSGTTVDAANPTSTSAPSAETTSPMRNGTTSVPGATITGETPCPAVDGSSARTTTFGAAPPMCIDVAKTYQAKVTTNLGDFTMKLDPKLAPLAVNNFVTLSRYHYYDGTDFHRVIPGFVVQGGDATGQPAGSGGPGYAFKDELPASADLYQPGTVAMANSGPDSNGSQFYVVLAAGRLQAQYSIFGQVTEGFDTTIQAIAAGGTSGGTPKNLATITTVTITEQ